MNAIDIKAARLARMWGQAPQAWSDSETVAALGETLWFAQVRLSIAAHELLRPITNPVRQLLRRAFA